MYLDHPQISATNGDTEPDRVERLNRTYGYAIALADVDDNHVCISKLNRLHDHKGTLIVYWKQIPSQREKSFFAQAWQSQVGDMSDNVSHQLGDTTDY